MRYVEYLSPTSISTWEEDREEFYKRYLADDRPPRFAQTEPMAVGSAFDAYVKSNLYEWLNGKNNNPKYDFDNLFEAQVEEQNRDFALEAGKICFEAYRTSGALADLMVHLRDAEEVHFEITVEGVVDGYREGVQGNVGDVTFLGKPDAFFTTKSGRNVILDWKVNGYCSKNGATPKKYYVKIRDGWQGTPSRGANKHHKDAHPMTVDGVIIDVANNFEDVDETWASQLSIYSWLCGEPVGGDFIVAVDQLACSKGKIRVAQLRNRISDSYQITLHDKAKEIWEIIHSDHIFRDLTIEESKAKCEKLDKHAEVFRNKPDWFQRLVRG